MKDHYLKVNSQLIDLILLNIAFSCFFNVIRMLFGYWLPVSEGQCAAVSIGETEQTFQLYLRLLDKHCSGLRFPLLSTWHP